MIYLSLQQIIAIHEQAIKDYGGSLGIRDEGLLRSAVARPQMSAFGEDAYKTIFEKAAALGHSIIQNHPFIDGNKRVGFAAMMIMLKVNGNSLKAKEEQKIDFVYRIAEGKFDIPAMTEWLMRYCIES